MIFDNFIVGIIIGFAICLTLFEMVRKGLFKWVGSARPTHDVVKNLVKECSQWAMVAEQDKSDMLALTHANYAVSHYYALQQIATPEYVYESCGVKLDSIGDEVKLLQKKCADKVILSRPDLMPPGSVFSEAIQNLTQSNPI